ncbi:hypothetical protein, partial [Bradyrhizobium sp. Leo170]|uniref:hypothetical protein n=1 Tax=Bradyrhizobium sp. Leo170 TaxID=1571199 RepID=UPI001A92E5AF
MRGHLRRRPGGALLPILLLETELMPSTQSYLPSKRRDGLGSGVGLGTSNRLAIGQNGIGFYRAALLVGVSAVALLSAGLGAQARPLGSSSVSVPVNATAEQAAAAAQQAQIAA